MKKLTVLSEFNLKEIDNGFILKIRKRNTGLGWEKEVYIDHLAKAGAIFNLYLVDKAAPGEEEG